MAGSRHKRPDTRVGLLSAPVHLTLTALAQCVLRQKHTTTDSGGMTNPGRRQHADIEGGFPEPCSIPGTRMKMSTCSGNGTETRCWWQTLPWRAGALVYLGANKKMGLRWRHGSCCPGRRGAGALDSQATQCVLRMVPLSRVLWIGASVPPHHQWQEEPVLRLGCGDPARPEAAGQRIVAACHQPRVRLSHRPVE